MANFIKDIANIKLTKIAKDNKLDYSNIIKQKAKKEDIKKFEKELKKELLIALVKENLSEDEKIALLDIKDFLSNTMMYDNVYTCDQNTMNSIYIIYKMLESD